MCGAPVGVIKKNQKPIGLIIEKRVEATVLAIAG